ncbi:hypothetical protein CEUSTIGMA_g2867.t1 [Chlamydomonas eustigma]|uniref:Elongator complex protein 4 n=1 Tax=Chlamydomonas eustigma TaxID=1157962 RepID=A0A250WX57_9CHLO|nr:hypothetical protein CEUSTIGMA_g2867.t1 [Chlamydomonas eustigma]|eukprot:GAX75423.1 hypothetical protein CEUSTIGMA_g2867.t1 [Chlamydomonas eustigma]
MRSSFTRKSPANADAGTRAGLHGQTLISMGLVDLDKLLGGGLPLGSLLLILEDAHSKQHLNLMKYFMAEGLTIGQKVAWLTSRPAAGGPGQFLPAEYTASSVSNAHKDNDDEEGSRSELRIAWQYRKYIQQKSSAVTANPSSSSVGSSSVGYSIQSPDGGAKQQAAAGGSSNKAVEAGIGREWCHSFDLTKCMGEEAVEKRGLLYLNCGRGQDLAASTSSVSHAYQQAHNWCASFQRTSMGVSGSAAMSTTVAPPVVSGSIIQGVKGPESVGRLVVESLGSPDWWLNVGSLEGQEAESRQASCVPLGWMGAVDQQERERQVVAFIQQLKHRVQDSRCSALVTCPAGSFSTSTMLRLQHASDVVFSIQTISDDSEVYALLPDASSSSALFSLTKLPSAGMIAPRLPDASLYVIRNKRRRIAISMVDIDPDASARQQDQLQLTVHNASSTPDSSEKKKVNRLASKGHASFDF